MSSIRYRDENSASAALAGLLIASSHARGAFWSLAKGSAAAARRTLPRDIAIEHRVRTDQRREIDLLLHSGTFGVIVECKVGDGKKPYQFDAYIAYWKRTRGPMPHLVWLLEQDQPILGDNRFPIVTFTWRRLRTSLQETANLASAAEAVLIRDFCVSLVAAGIGLENRPETRKEKKSIGYDAAHAALIFNGILEQANGVEGAPMRINALTPALHAGRISWSTPLDDPWVRRVWLYFIPLGAIPDQKQPFHFRAQVLLFQGGFSNKASRKLPLVPQWASRLKAQGLALWRNESDTWTRTIALADGEGVHPGIRYIFGEEDLTEAQRRAQFDWRSDSAAIKAGASHLQHFIQLFDRILRETTIPT